MPVFLCELGIAIAIHLARGSNVQHGKRGNGMGVVGGHAVRHSRPTVVTSDKHALKAEMTHRRDQVGGHCPFGIGRVLRIAGRLARVPVTA